MRLFRFSLFAAIFLGLSVALLSIGYMSVSMTAMQCQNEMLRSELGCLEEFVSSLKDRTDAIEDNCLTLQSRIDKQDNIMMLRTKEWKIMQKRLEHQTKTFRSESEAGMENMHETQTSLGLKILEIDKRIKNIQKQEKIAKDTKPTPEKETKPAKKVPIEPVPVEPVPAETPQQKEKPLSLREKVSNLFCVATKFAQQYARENEHACRKWKKMWDGMLEERNGDVLRLANERLMIRLMNLKSRKADDIDPDDLYGTCRVFLTYQEQKLPLPGLVLEALRSDETYFKVEGLLDGQ